MSNVGHEKPMSKCNKTKNMLYYVIKKSCSDNHHEQWCNAHGQWHKEKNVRKKEYKLAQTKSERNVNTNYFASTRNSFSHCL